MGALIGLPEWLFATLFAAAFVSLWFAVAWGNTRRSVATIKASRRSPDEDAFRALMQPDVSPEVSAFLWRMALPYASAWGLTPHPDDLLSDLPIDEDDWSFDWPREWAEAKGFHESNLADWPDDWPDDWPVTVRNFGRWLDLGPQ